MKFKKTLVATIAGLAMVVGVACSATRTQKSAGEQIDDSALTASVKAALIADPVTKARQIDVEVRRGVVQLNGFVDSAAEKAQAATVATGVDGVMGVQNNLAVNTASLTEPPAAAGAVAPSRAPRRRARGRTPTRAPSTRSRCR